MCFILNINLDEFTLIKKKKFLCNFEYFISSYLFTVWSKDKPVGDW